MKTPTKYEKYLSGWKIIILENEDEDEIEKWLQDNNIKHRWNHGLLLIDNYENLIAVKLRFEKTNK